MKLSWYQVMLPVVPAVSILLWGHLRWGREIVRDWKVWVITVAYLLAPIATAYLGQVNKAYGLAYALCVTFGAASFVLRAQDRADPRTAVAGALISVIAIVAAVPVTLLRPADATIAAAAPREPLTGELDLQFFDSSLATIEESIATAAAAIETEKAAMAREIGKLTEGLESRKLQLHELNERHDQLQAEAERYRLLLNFSDEEIEAITTALQRGKNVDYFVGFLLGILSSGAVAIVSRFALR